MSQYLYSNQYTPPAPVMEIRLGFPGRAALFGPFIALIDTGADATYVPAELLRQINAPFINRGIVRSQWGERRSVKLHTVTVKVGQFIIPVVTVISDSQSSEVVLGRNFLNRWQLNLDGPGALTQIIGEPI
jgi:predicted aspartyl protease